MKKKVGRREFMGSMAAAGAALVAGCETTPSQLVDAGAADSQSDDMRSQSDGSRSGDSRSGDGPGDGIVADAAGLDGQGADTLAPTCGQLTESNIEGPFFSPNSPARQSLRQDGMQGTLLVISGKVLAPDCRPVAGAMLDFWQANAAGEYDNVGFTLRGHQRAGLDGSYRLESIIPGHYLNGVEYRPAHIHVKVAGKSTLLTTQLYFAGDPYNSIDPWILPSLIMTPTETASGEKLAQFDFVVA